MISILATEDDLIVLEKRYLRRIKSCCVWGQNSHLTYSQCILSHSLLCTWVSSPVLPCSCFSHCNQTPLNSGLTCYILPQLKDWMYSRQNIEHTSEGLTHAHPITEGLTRAHPVSERLTCAHQISVGLTRAHPISEGLTCTHPIMRDSLVLTQSVRSSLVLTQLVRGSLMLTQLLRGSLVLTNCVQLLWY